MELTKKQKKILGNAIKRDLERGKSIKEIQKELVVYKNYIEILVRFHKAERIMAAASREE